MREKYKMLLKYFVIHIVFIYFFSTLSLNSIKIKAYRQSHCYFISETPIEFYKRSHVQYEKRFDYFKGHLKTHYFVNEISIEIQLVHKLVQIDHAV